ncbi:hypothetical protein GCM10018962_89960 [Dactylosporangium matsuzakiense]|uniref:Uncharacterized protein n=1 Tax=Dactylosporangium matsuzakiense TaxID=53360 RepID=A0A9W6KJB0_9ACTN|nr:hypothetical protein GCM10017581_030370 [Dactylosporangium matsuzakiense]
MYAKSGRKLHDRYPSPYHHASAPAAYVAAQRTVRAGVNLLREIVTNPTGRGRSRSLQNCHATSDSPEDV